MSRLRALFLAVVLVGSLAAGSVGAIPSPGPGVSPPPGPPSPPSTPSPSTPAGTVTAGTPTGNASGGGGGLLGGLGVTGDFFRDPVGMLTDGVRSVSHAVLLGAAYVPAPNSMGDYFRAPTNGIWPDLWNTRQDKARPIFWGLAGASLLLTALGAAMGVLPRSHRAGWGRKWLLNFALGYMAWTLAGAWLTTRKGLTFWLLQDVTAGGLETTLASLAVIAAVVVALLFNIWILVALLALVGMSFGGVAAVTPWLGVLFMARAFPFPPVAKVGDVGVKFWFFLTVLTLPVAALVGFGFSFDVAAHFDPSAVALSDPGAVSGAVALALLSAAVKFGSILGGILAAGWLFAAIKGVGVATGVVAAPSPSDLQQRYQRGRERAGKVRERSRAAANVPREVARGARGRPSVDPETSSTRSYDAGRVVHDYAHAARRGGSRSASASRGSSGSRERAAARDGAERRQTDDD